MRKKLLPPVLALLALLLILPAPAYGAPALPLQAELVVLDRRQDIVIAIGFDVEAPDVAVVSPSGQVYGEDADYDLVERADRALYLYILNAEAGSWTIHYDKKGNSVMEAVVTPWNHPLSIDSLTVSEVQDGRLTMTAEVSCDERVRYQYYAYAVTFASDGSVDGKTELGHGSGTSGGTLNLRLPVSGLPDGDYYLQLEVYYTNDSGAELPAFRISDVPFAVTGNTQTGDASQFISVLDLTQDILTLDWSGVAGRYTSWVLALYTGGSVEPAYYTNFEENVRADELLLDRGEGDVRVTLVGAVRGGGYVSFERTVKWDTGVVIKFETPEFTNSLRGAIRFDAGGLTLRAELSINGGTEQLQLSGSDTLSFRLEEMQVNEVSLRYQLEEGAYYLVSQRISVDSVPPTLTLYGLPDEVTTAERTIIVSGGTEAGAVLTMNGETQQTDDSGEFMAEISLQEGRNILVFEASDAAGNKTSRTLIVHYSPSGTVEHTGGNSSDGSGQFPWILVGTAACSLLALLFMWIFSAVVGGKIRKDGGGAATLRKILAVLAGLLSSLFVSGAGLAVLFMVLASRKAALVSGSNLITAIEEYSTEEIAGILAQRASLRSWALTAAIIAVVALALTILLLYFIGKLGKEKPEQPPVQPPMQPPVQPPMQPPVQPPMQPPMQPPIRNNVCPHCGAPLEPNARFCVHCGKPLW